MKLLCFADLHLLNERKLDFISEINGKYDVVLLLGDITDSLLEVIIEKIPNDKPILGVLGNHDSYNSFEGLPIINMNDQRI